jgi:hypothetical protein
VSWKEREWFTHGERAEPIGGAVIDWQQTQKALTQL